MFTFLVLYYYISQDSFVHPANEMRIGELHPSLAETPLYPPKLVLLGKDKKGNIVNLMWKMCHKCMCMTNHQL